MTRKPRHAQEAEYSFKVLCARAGVIPQTVTEDVTGWDCFVQFPLSDFDGPAEEAPSDREAMVQIKSTIGSRPRTNIKLSNVVNMCKDPKPWFVAIMQRQDNGAERWYVQHVDRKWMARGLAAARIARVDNVSLNKRSISITFRNDDEHSTDLLQWMEGQISAPLPSYGADKLKYYKECGYEDGRERLTFGLEGDPDEISLTFLGKQSLPAVNVRRTDVRFGIPEKEPNWTADRIRVSLKPLDRKTCRVLLKPNGLDEEICIDASYASTPFPVAHASARLHIDAGFLEFFLKPTSAEFDVNFDSEGTRSLRDLSNFCKVVGWVSERKITVKTEAMGTRPLQGSFGPFKSNGKMHAALADILSFFVANSDGVRCETTLRSIWDTRDRLSNVYHLNIPRLARWTFPDLLPEPVNVCVYGSSIQIGECRFLFVTRRRVNSVFELNDGTKGYNLELPRIVARRVVSADDSTFKLQEMVDDVLDTIGPEAFGIADILDMLDDKPAEIRVGTR